MTNSGGGTYPSGSDDGADDDASKVHGVQVIVEESSPGNNTQQVPPEQDQARVVEAVERPDDAGESKAAGSNSGGDDPQAGVDVVEVVVIPVQGSENVASSRGNPAIIKPEDGPGLLRCASAFSTDSLADCCRICQHHGDEPLLELGCHCRGELAKAHRSCIQQWFGNKGSNKCEICQHVAENVPAPPAQTAPHFWVWRLGINRGSRGYIQERNGGGTRFHPLWAALLILIAGLLFDVLISIFLGASALPVNIIIGVLVVLGIGTAARLVVECWHERGLRRNIRRIENNLAHLQEEIHGNVVQGQSNMILQPDAVAVRPQP